MVNRREHRMEKKACQANSLGTIVGRREADIYQSRSVETRYESLAGTCGVEGRGFTTSTAVMASLCVTFPTPGGADLTKRVNFSAVCNHGKSRRAKFITSSSQPKSERN